MAPAFQKDISKIGILLNLKKNTLFFLSFVLSLIQKQIILFYLFHSKTIYFEKKNRTREVIVL